MLSQHFLFADITVYQQEKSADAIMRTMRRDRAGRSLVIMRTEKFFEKAVTALLIESLLIIKRNELEERDS